MTKYLILSKRLLNNTDNHYLSTLLELIQANKRSLLKRNREDRLEEIIKLEKKVSKMLDIEEMQCQNLEKKANKN